MITSKLLDGTLAELFDVEPAEVSFVPRGANGVPELLAVKGIPNEFVCHMRNAVRVPVSLPDGSLAYTRDGSWKRDGQGNVVTSNGLFIEPGLTIPENVTRIYVSPSGLVEGFDPAEERDLVFIPIGINYDRVLEDRSLIKERIVGARRPGRFSQLYTVAAYLWWNTVRLLTGRTHQLRVHLQAIGHAILGALADLCDQLEQSSGAGRVDTRHRRHNHPT